MQKKNSKYTHFYGFSCKYTNICKNNLHLESIYLIFVDKLQLNNSCKHITLKIL